MSGSLCTGEHCNLSAAGTSLTGDGFVSARERQGRWLGDACVSLLLTARYLQWYLTQARHQEWQEDSGEG